MRTLRVALVQGGGQRGLSKDEVSPTTVLAAQLAATYAVATARPSPRLVLWPEDVVALDRPLASDLKPSVLAASDCIAGRGAAAISRVLAILIEVSWRTF